MKVSEVGSFRGTRIKVTVNGQDRDVNILGASTATTAAPSVSGTLVGATATGVAAILLQSGGTGLISSGPQSSFAATVLGAMNSLGSAGAAQWSIANPCLGGSAQITVGSILEGVGGGSASGSSNNLRSPS